MSPETYYFVTLLLLHFFFFFFLLIFFGSETILIFPVHSTTLKSESPKAQNLLFDQLRGPGPEV